MMELHEIVERKHEVRTLPPAPQFVKQRIASAAEELSRAGDMAMHVELVNEALAKLTVMLYAADSDGAFANVDARTGRVLVPLPWGNKGWKRWGLRYWEAVTLRSILMSRVTRPRHAPLFDYNVESRTWHIDLTNYPNLGQAQTYFARNPILLAEWRGYYIR